MRNSHHVTKTLAVQSQEDDDAIVRLQLGLAADKRGNKATVDGGLEVITINEDPENAKRRAELAEKEKAKMARRYQNQQDREANRANNVLKRAGIGGGGLTREGLEGTDTVVGGKARKSKAKPKKPRRRNDEYSDEDDFRGRRRTREDEYDEDDGFLVGSDEEPEIEEESEEEEDADLDAEGEEDDEVVAEQPKPMSHNEDAVGGGGRQKRRRIIEDEDEE